MKIITWNINGLRAGLRKGIWSWIEAQAPDVVCMQEIKTRPDQIDGDDSKLFKDYTILWNPAAKPGYSGVATFLRNKADGYQIGMGDDRFDHEGRLIQTQHGGTILFNMYVPSGQRDYGRVEYKLSFYQAVLNLCDELHANGAQLILCGDFNTAHREIDLRNPRQNRQTSGFLPEERAWIDRYLAHGFTDIYRAIYPERVQYTWWTFVSNARQRNVGWRLDYFLVSTSLCSIVQDVVIHDDVLGSDHCPVSLILK